MVKNLTKTSNVCFVPFLTKPRLRSLTLKAARLLTDMVCKYCASLTAPYLRFTGGFFAVVVVLNKIHEARAFATHETLFRFSFLFFLFFSLQNVFGFKSLLSVQSEMKSFEFLERRLVF